MTLEHGMAHRCLYQEYRYSTGIVRQGVKVTESQICVLLPPSDNIVVFFQNPFRMRHCGSVLESDLGGSTVNSMGRGVVQHQQMHFRLRIKC